jgi:hypothetical protein
VHAGGAEQRRCVRRVGGDRSLELLERPAAPTACVVHEGQRDQGVVHPIVGLDRPLGVLRRGVGPCGVVGAQITVRARAEQGRIVLQARSRRLQGGQEHRVAPLETVLPQRPLERVERGRPLATPRLGQRRDEQRVVVIGLELQHPPRLGQGLVVLPARQGDLGQRESRRDGLGVLRELAPRQRLRQLVVAGQQRPRRRGLSRLHRGRHARAVPAGRDGEIADQVVGEAASRRQRIAEKPNVHPAHPVERSEAHQQDDAGNPQRVVEVRRPLA